MKNRIHNGKLNKKSLSSFIDYDCEKHLYLSLGSNDPRWVTREITIREGKSDMTQETLRLGKEYEAGVYHKLIEFFDSDVHFNGNTRKIKPTTLSIETLNNLYTAFQTVKRPQIALEYNYKITNEFVLNAFGLSSKEKIPTLGNETEGTNRPDILIFGNHPHDVQEAPLELCSDGSIKPVQNLEQRIGISIIDIKNSTKDRISLRHYSELLFYAHSLRFYLDTLEKQGLPQNFYVRVNGHSIFGRTDISLFKKDIYQLMWANPTNIDKHQMLTSPMVWDDTKELFYRFKQTVQKLYKEALENPNIDAIDLKIQQKCARCPYIDDCTKQLSGCDEPDLQKHSAEAWDIRLIPLLKSDVAKQIFDIAEQINEPSLKTIGGLQRNLQKLSDSLGDVPTPLHAELPSLKMRTTALLQNEVIAGSSGFMSKALPRQINMALTFDIEMEDLHDIVFAFAVNLVTVAPFNWVDQNLRKTHSDWWNAWADFLSQHKRRQSPNIQDVYDTLPHHLLKTKIAVSLSREDQKLSEEEQEKKREELRKKELLSLLEQMKDAILFLSRYGNLIIQKFGTKRKGNDGVTRSEPKVEYHISNLSLGFEDKHEYGLLQSLIKVLYHIITICWTTERLAIAEKPNSKNAEEPDVISQSFAGFYWSARQVEAVRKMVERHLDRLQEDKKLFPIFLQLVDWISPSDSQVQNHQFSEKMYDFEAFIKQGVSFPQVIAYSWHELITYYWPKFSSDKRYWIPHFNFMDFTVWYDVLNSDDDMERDQHKSDIKQQLKIKMDCFQFLLLKLHTNANQVKIIPHEAKTITTNRYLQESANRNNFNSLAKAWYAYSKLNASTSQLETDYFRMIWPEYGIAKLRVGELSDITIIKNDDNDKITPTRFQFSLKNLSSNMKLKTGDWTKILHEKCRDLSRYWWVDSYASTFNIEDMVWNPEISGYQITGHIDKSRANTKKFSEEEKQALYNYPQWCELHGKKEEPHQSIFSLFKELGKTGWHLYLSDSDHWSGKLYSSLHRSRLGYSWLGKFLSLQQGLLNREYIATPEDNNVSASALYLYAPNLLPKDYFNLETKLKTEIKYAPDASQEKAILQSLSLPISCIQGPPGTGKSQTIVALIDEFVLRFKAKYNRLPKILVSAFSYTALTVVLEKILESRTGEGQTPDPDQPSEVAKMPLFFASSAHKEMDFSKLNIHKTQKPPIHLQYDGSWSINKGNENKETIGFRKMPGLSLFGRIFHHSGISIIEEEAFVEPLKDNGKPKSKTAKQKEQKIIKQQQMRRNNELGFVLFANAYTIYNLAKPHKSRQYTFLPDDFGFDLIIIDEASQMPTAQFVPISELLKPFQAEIDISDTETFTNEDENGNPIKKNYASEDSIISISQVPENTELSQVVLVGDQEQLPPIQQIKPSEKLHPLIDSIFRYFLEVHNTPNSELSNNYRSHKDIVACIQELGIYGSLTAFRGDKWLENFPTEIPTSVKQDWIRQLLKKEQVVSTITHQGQWDTSLSEFEAELTTQIIIAFYDTVSPQTAKEEESFWKEEIGVVAPHNAHGNLISRKTLQELESRSQLSPVKLKEMLDSSIYSVEKFQGSDRSFIIGTVGVSSQDQLLAEQEFLYDLNRFNVLISRAKHKMLLICSENYLRFVPTEKEIMGVASQIRKYANELCNQEKEYATTWKGASNPIRLRWMGK